jgi:hypothetical protein
MIDNSKSIEEKDKWNPPKLFSLNINKTESGSPYEGKEDVSYFDPTQSP